MNNYQNSQNSQNPWGGNNNNQSPPDLDEAINELKAKFGSFFGGNNNGNGEDAKIVNDSNSGFPSSPIKFKYVFILLAIIWLGSGFYIVDPAEKGVVFRLGAVTGEVGGGPHWHLPYPIEKVEIVNVSEVRIAEIGFRNLINNSGASFTRNVPTESIMLTSDGNIVDASFEIQYTVDDLKYYLLSVKAPEETLVQVANSVIREVIGKNKIDYIITDGRAEIASKIKINSQILLDFYKVGLHINTVNFKSAQAPSQVQEAYSDVTKAKTDKERYINQSQSYANDIIPKARGKSARMIEEATAYKSQIVSKSEGETNRFLQLLGEYQKSKEVTRERLYRETMEEVFANTSKIITSGNSNSLMYLPIDKLIANSRNANNENSDTNTIESQNNDSLNLRNAFRNRGSK